MVKEFIKGETYRYVGPKKRPAYFNQDGQMDAVLDGKPVTCQEVREPQPSGKQQAIFNRVAGWWTWKPTQFELPKIDNWKERILE